MDFNAIILTPTTGFIRSQYVSSLANLLLYYLNHNIYPEGGRQSIAYENLESSGICSAREHMVGDALARFPGMTHVCFIDEDMGFEPQALFSLASRRLPIVGVNYRFRKRGGMFTALKPDASGRVITTIDSSGVERVAYTGFGLCLIERQVFEKTPKPWFYMAYGHGDDSYGTEDGWFSWQTRKAGFDWHVDHDASKSITHVGSYEFRWDQKEEAGL